MLVATHFVRSRYTLLISRYIYIFLFFIFLSLFNCALHYITVTFRENVNVYLSRYIFVSFSLCRFVSAPPIRFSYMRMHICNCVSAVYMCVNITYYVFFANSRLSSSARVSYRSISLALPPIILPFSLSPSTVSSSSEVRRNSLTYSIHIHLSPLFFFE